MSNNTSKYQEYTFKELLDQYDRILVPMIQRDYAQGRTDKKATDVRNNLLTDIFSDKNVHFDLVFGSKEKRIIDGKEMNCFIPVDGQQRLTTLFLLHLYGQKEGKTNTDLNLSKFSYDTRRAASDFCKSITSEKWVVPNDKNVSDVIKDSSWFMNYWEKDPTVEGMVNMLDAIQEKCKERTDYPNLNKVTFFFFDLESNGLNENLYLKMNSRGKPLTAFENLKAKIEKVLPDIIKVDNDSWFPICNAAPEDFKGKWKFFMDRNWTEAFWDQDHPEKYDESITKFIVRFLSGYWAAYGEDDEQMNDELKSLNEKDSYADFIPFEPIKKILKLEDAFPKLAYALTSIIDNSKIAPYWCKDNNSIAVSDKSEYKFLTVVFTYVLFGDDEAAKRFAWNMAENYVTGYNNYITYCRRAKEIEETYDTNGIHSFYKVLSNNSFSNPSEQLNEEIAKAKQILDENGGLRNYDGSCKKSNGFNYQTWEDIIIDAEKYAFFKGAVRFLFTDGEGKTIWSDFHTKWENALKYFDKKGVKEEFKKNAILLRSFISKYNKWGDLCGVNYDNEPSTWKVLLTSRLKSAHYILFNGVCSEEEFNTYNSTLAKFDKGYENLQKAVHEELVKTSILVEAAQNNSRLNWRYNVYSLYPYNTKAQRKIYVIGNHRNSILSTLCDNNTIMINGDNRFESGDSKNFFWGWDINFEYNNIQFQWNVDNYIYYLRDGKRLEKDKESSENCQKYYCFIADGLTPNLFIEELNKLIDQVYNIRTDIKKQ